MALPAPIAALFDDLGVTEAEVQDAYKRVGVLLAESITPSAATFTATLLFAAVAAADNKMPHQLAMQIVDVAYTFTPHPGPQSEAS